MVVTEDMVSAALDYLNADPHPLAAARRALAQAENVSAEAYARALLKAEGSVAVRESMAICDPDYQTTKEDEADETFAVERERAKVRGAEMIIEVWRTDSANARAAESVR